MRLLRLINRSNDETWLLENQNGIRGLAYDANGAIRMLAKPHTENIEVRVLYEKYLGSFDEYASFKILWKDGGTAEEFKNAFDACFAFGHEI